jgi:carbamoyl-phosphate synthase small subunit
VENQDNSPAPFPKITRGRAALIDLGVKKSIITHLEAIGVETFPYDMGFALDEIVAGQYDCLVLSNGPGDPADIPEVILKIEALLGKVPILGICLGHQVTALAMGGNTYKMKFGHRGANHPVNCRRTGRVFITSQNHGYAVSDDLEQKTDAVITYTNANDGTVEGFADLDRRIECLQFHPEASPGPHDMTYFFEEYFQKIEGRKNATVA